jgi:UDP-glucuronate 4-epimerase
MRALVTGCAGFIGSHLTEALLDTGHSVVGIDCFNGNYGREQKLANLRHVRDWNSFEFVPIDLSRGDLLAFVRAADVVFHLAAEPGVRASWGERYERYVQNNIIATQHLLEACREAPDVRVVYASSSSVYGDAAPRAGGPAGERASGRAGALQSTSEEPSTRPISPYGQTKLAAEQLCGLYRHELGLDVVCLRYFTVFGPRQRPDMAFHRFLRAALGGAPVTVLGDGRQTRDFTYVGDVVAATIAAATAPQLSGRALDVGGGAPTTLLRALQVIGELVDRPLRVEYAARGHGEVRDTRARVAPAREALGFSPQVSLEQGLAAELEWIVALLDRDRARVPA